VSELGDQVNDKLIDAVKHLNDGLGHSSEKFGENASVDFCKTMDHSVGELTTATKDLNNIQNSIATILDRVSANITSLDLKDAITEANNSLHNSLLFYVIELSYVFI